jgi:hypothetical protein
MASGIFYRNIRARDQLELFLLAAITSLLAVRFYLYITGYPQIGSGGLHIAHMLWGGALMLGGIVIGLSFLGARAQRLMALIGGVGFGVFIDELGKFITRDNNYFYQPAIGIIYAIFIILYLLFNFLSRSRPLDSREYQLNALSQLEEAIVRDMDPTEKQQVKELLERADQQDPVTIQLEKVLANTRTVAHGKPNSMKRFVRWLDRQYVLFWKRRSSNLLVRLFFIAEVAMFVVAVLGVIYATVDGAFDIFKSDLSYSEELVWGQLLSSLVAAGFAIWGAVLLRRSRLRAYEQFRRATLINIFLTQFFMFSRIEFSALPGFVFNLVLLGLVGFAIRQEHRIAAEAAKK